MSSLATSPLARSIVKNPVVWSLTVLAVLAVGIVSASTPLLIVSCALAFGRPLLYAALLGPEDDARHAGQHLPFAQRASHRVGALGVF